MTVATPRPSRGPAEGVDLEAGLDAFAGRPIAVLGLARSGIALARFLHDRGARVTVYDRRSRAELADAVAALEGRSVRLLVGPEVDPADALRDQDLVTTSPSVSSRYPTTEPRLRAALAALEAEGRVPVVSEMDLFLRLCPAVTIGVTGTKGKTTTSSLSAAVLAAGPEPILLGGNIGIPLVERLPELTARHRVVLELSELQLPTLSRGTTVAVYTHVTQDHLDRHGSVEAYRRVKGRLAELLAPGGALVVNEEDPVSRVYRAPPSVRLVRYRRDTPPPGGVGLDEGSIVADRVPQLVDPGVTSSGSILPLSAITLPGSHNVSNVLAAVCVGLLFGIDRGAIHDAVAAFRPVPHRLEPVATIKGVLFVNDSQGTQPDAVIAALRSFAPPVVLICGGRDKGLPLNELAEVARERATAVVLIGENAPRLGAILERAGHRHVERATDLPAAVSRAHALARAALGQLGGRVRGATVLLSPAATSFDMFVDYEARGEAFREAVHALAARRGAGGAEAAPKGEGPR
ncbi:MAG TPA: UDP-N-acetylmuramoyl-L-alanine--D-glutamate ligase [Candidatus Limnocylindrales bacterium]|jgi:UDP-N-acetylmuramoylalanine--D-glutamate ligase|nr:UDP-N-acetylmuramoyl-L-alanine--D-glutamate ligase [Candidatus Limnocylindrales bacterium]